MQNENIWEISKNSVGQENCFLPGFAHVALCKAFSSKGKCESMRKIKIKDKDKALYAKVSTVLCCFNVSFTLPVT